MGTAMGFFGGTTQHGHTWSDELRDEEFALRFIEFNRQNPRFTTVTDAQLDALIQRIAGLRKLAKEEAQAVPMDTAEIPLFLRRQAD